MKKYKYFTCDVFTRERFGGNPLAVVPDARGLSGEAMQSLAREFNYSETTFVLPAREGNTRQVRIFTPGAEVPFAGHPNVGTAFMLAALGEIELADGTETVVFEEKAGLVPVRIERSGGEVFCEVTAPEALSVGDEVAVDLLADAVGLDAGEIVTAVHPPRAASVGLPFVFAEVAGRASLARAAANVAAMRSMREQGLPADVHIYTREAGDFDLQARMFAPLDGVPEDPATGSANCALIGLLAHVDTQSAGEWQWRIAQGVEMGRPSELFGRAEKTGGAVSTVRVGGYSVQVFEGSFTA